MKGVSLSGLYELNKSSSIAEIPLNMGTEGMKIKKCCQWEAETDFIME
jgi:hypothetical protein